MGADYCGPSVFGLVTARVHPVCHLRDAERARAARLVAELISPA